jgi:CHASE2 domain
MERKRLEEIALAQDELEKALNVAEKVQATLAEQLKRDRRRQLWYAWVLNIAVALTILVISIPTAGAIIARGLSADWQTDAFLDVPATQHPLLAVVAVDQRALEGYSSSPTDRHVLAQLVHRIDDLGAAAVGLDYFFVGPTEPEKDAELIDALRSAKAQIVVGVADERAGLEPRQRADRGTNSRRASSLGALAIFGVLAAFAASRSTCPGALRLPAGCSGLASAARSGWFASRVPHLRATTQRVWVKRGRSDDVRYTSGSHLTPDDLERSPSRPTRVRNRRSEHVRCTSASPLNYVAPDGDLIGSRR